MKLLLVNLILVLCLTACGTHKKSSKMEQPELSKEANLSINALSEKYYEEYLKLFPIEATGIGDNRYNDHLDFSIGAEHRRIQGVLYEHYLEALQNIKAETLSGPDHLTYEVLKDHLEMQREKLKWPNDLVPVAQIFSLPVHLPLLGSGKGMQPFRTVSDYEKFLKRAAEFPTWVDVAIDNMREGVRVGVVQAKIVVDKTLPQLRSMMVTNVTANVFYQPIAQMPGEFSSQDRQRLTIAYTAMIEKQLVPAYKKLHDFLLNEYRPRCRDAHGIWVLPQGRGWYRQKIREFTNTTLTPDEIHELGRAEVARIQGEMEKVRDREKFKGTLSAFVEHLKKRPGIGYTNRNDYVQAYESLRARVQPGLSNLFSHAPAASFEIRAIEEFRENSSPAHYFPATPDGSRPGVFYVNAASLKQGPAAISEALFLHEAIPGHHFQVSIIREQKGLPRLRRFALYNAYVEGWALYAESLGNNLGCYLDPLQEMDRLSSEMWRARRLVVDTGLHDERWTRDQAIEYLRENPVQSMSAELETDRYIAAPGQALGYKVGELKIKQLRDRAKGTLKGKWDIRQFHDELLKDGSLPLSVLERKMDAWMQANAPTQN